MLFAKNGMAQKWTEQLQYFYNTPQGSSISEKVCRTNQKNMKINVFVFFKKDIQQFSLLSESWHDYKGRHDTQHNNAHHNDAQHNDAQHNNAQHNDTQHNDAQHNDAQHNDAQHYDTQHNDIQHNNK